MNNTNWFKVGFLAGMGLITAVAVVTIGFWTLGVVGDAASKLAAEAEIKRAQAAMLRSQAQAQAAAQAEMERRLALADQAKKQPETQAPLDVQQSEQDNLAEIHRQAELASKQGNDNVLKGKANDLVTEKTICIFQRVGDSLGIDWNVSGANVVLYQDGIPRGLRINITSGMQAQTNTYKLLALAGDNSVVASRTLILKVNPTNAPARLLCDDTTVLDSNDPHFR